MLVSADITRHDHSIIACLRNLSMAVFLRAHFVRGEPRIQRNASGEVATVVNLPNFSSCFQLLSTYWPFYKNVATCGTLPIK